jgi:hypothetical protein
MSCFKWVGSKFEMGKPYDKPPAGILARLDPERIVYTEHLMRKEGYAPRQVWRKGASEPKVTQGAYVKQ